MRRITIFDTTLRDGEQSPGINLQGEEKLEIAKQLARLRVDVIEAGFPVASPGEFQAVERIAREVEGPVVAALARTMPKDIERAAEAIRPAERGRIHTFIATSPIHMEHKLGKSPDEVVKMAVGAVKYAKQFCDDVEFSAEDGTRSDWAFLTRIFRAAIEAGATTLNIPDTVGYTVPEEYGRLITHLREHTPGIEAVSLSVHCHDDLGLAVANSVAAVQAGADQIECTINGLGERAGNASLEELVMAMRTRHDLYRMETGIETEQIYRSSRLVSALAGMVVQPNKAIVGANAFAHESGIHQDGVLKDRTTYEIMTPESIGLTQSRLVLGKHSGRHAFQARLVELGYKLSDEEAAKAYDRFIELADRKKKVADRDIEALIESELGGTPEHYALEYLHISSGNTTVPTATVRMLRGEDLYEEASSGDGPVDAAYKAIDRVTGLSVELVSYALQGVTEGKDALGEVSVRIQEDGKRFAGRGTSTDVIEASARAYVQAVNKLLEERGRRAVRAGSVADHDPDAQAAGSGV